MGNAVQHHHGHNATTTTKSGLLTGVSLHYVQVSVVRLMKQLSEVYSTMKIGSLATMVPFASFGEVEAIVVDAVKSDFLQVHVDHRNGTLHFGRQQLESDRIRNHMSTLAKRLSKVAGMMYPGVSAEREANRATAIQQALDKMQEEHRRANARKVSSRRASFG